MKKSELKALIREVIEELKPSTPSPEERSGPTPVSDKEELDAFIDAQKNMLKQAASPAEREKAIKNMYLIIRKKFPDEKDERYIAHNLHDYLPSPKGKYTPGVYPNIKQNYSHLGL